MHLYTTLCKVPTEFRESISIDFDDNSWCGDKPTWSVGYERPFTAEETAIKTAEKLRHSKNNYLNSLDYLENFEASHPEVAAKARMDGEKGSVKTSDEVLQLMSEQLIKDGFI